MGSKCRKIYKYTIGDHTLFFVNKNDKYHNLNGPAYVRFIPPFYNRVSLMEYYIDGRLCDRDDKPAITYFFKSGKVKREAHYKNGLLSNEFGPSIIEYNEGGDIIYRSFFKNGNRV